MTMPISLVPSLTGSVLPPANPLELSDDEQRVINGLSMRLSVESLYIRERYLYYDGEQAAVNLGISVPDVLKNVRQALDWSRVACDRLVERASQIDGFRRPGSTEIDTELAEHWQANDLDAEFPLVQQDSLVGGRGYMIVGSPDTPGESPIVTVESPLNLAIDYDARSRTVLAAYQSYEVQGRYKASLYLPNQTIDMSRDEGGLWAVDRRDVHNFGQVPVVRFPNRSRTSDRDGRSQITRAIMSETDRAIRSLLGMDIAREVYSVPHLWVLGAKESDFQDAQGNPKSRLGLAMTAFNALERDENGEVPTLFQARAFDPSVFTKIIDHGAQMMSSYTGFPPSYFGQNNTANPASADAIRVGLDGVARGAERVQLQSASNLRTVAQLIWRFANDGRPIPPEMKRMSIDWVDAATPTPAADADAVAKQVAAGILPARSDVTLRRLRYTALERARIAQDWANDPAAQLEGELTSSLATRQARAGNAIANDLETAAAPTSDTQTLPPQSR